MLPILTQYIEYVFWALYVVAVGWALWKGGEPERAGAAVMLYLFVVQATAYAIQQPRYVEVDEISFLADAIAVVGFCFIAIHANRVWPLVAGALQLLSLAFHFARAVNPEVIGLAYGLMKSGPTAFVLLMLLLGTIFHQRRLAVHSEYRDWTCQFVDVERVARGQVDEDAYQKDLAQVLARGFLERPMILNGSLVALYALFALTTLIDTQASLIAAVVLLTIGLATIFFGRWWWKREQRNAEERLEDFNERWTLIREDRKSVV